MAHEIANIAGKDAMFVVGKREDAWHLLGQRCLTAVNSIEAIKLAGLDYQMLKSQNYSYNPAGVLVPVDSYSVFRDVDNACVASKIGAGFSIKQIKECFQFVDDLLGANEGSHYDSAGALYSGATIWISARVPKADIAIGDDKSEMYLVFTTAFDGTCAHTGFLSRVRIVCANTRRQALSMADSKLKIKHTKNAEQRFADARIVMNGVLMDSQKLQDKLNLLASKRVTRESLDSIFDRLFPKPEDGSESKRRTGILEDIMALYESNDNNAFPEQRGTAYNLLNAVDEYVDHYRGIRVTESREALGMKPEVIRAENAVMGTGEKLKELALATIIDNMGRMIDYKPVSVAVSAVPPLSPMLDSVIAATDTNNN